MINVVYGGFGQECIEGDDLVDFVVVIFFLYIVDDFFVMVYVEVDVKVGY